MRKVVVGLLVFALVFASALFVHAQKSAGKTPWSLKASYVEACSCPLFCMCYFNTSPAGGHHCEFNNAIIINQGNFGDLKLDGMKVWMSGDLGGDFTTGKANWVVFTFEPSATKEQMDAVMTIMAKGVYAGFEWPVLAVEQKPMTIVTEGPKPYARLGKGEAEVSFEPSAGTDQKPVVIPNLQYWGAKKNNGFHLFYSNHHYTGHGKKFNYEKVNGFRIDIESAGTL